MKAKNYLLLATAALALAACTGDDNDPADDPNAPMEIRLTSTLEVQTRAATDIQGTAFDTDEKVDVFISEAVADGQSATTTYAQPLIYTVGTEGTLNIAEANRPYFPSSGNGVNIWAVYPSGAHNNSTFSIKSDQSTDADYKASDLMYGLANNPVSRIKTAVPITFKHLLSKVTVKLEAGDGLTDTGLAGAKVELLGVKPDVPFTASDGTIGTADGTETAVTVFTATSSALEGSAVIAPQTLPEEFVRVTLKDGGVLTGKLNDSSQPALTSGNEYTYTIIVNLTSLGMTASITSWGHDSNHHTSDGNASMDNSHPVRRA